MFRFSFKIHVYTKFSYQGALIKVIIYCVNDSLLNSTNENPKTELYTITCGPSIKIIKSSKKN